MTHEFREDREGLSTYTGLPLRRVNGPLFTGADIAAFVVTLIMVCGPLAMGAFRL